MVMALIGNVQAQTTQPTWWFGVSGAANSNFYSGTTQRLNNSLIVPAAFHKGFGVQPFGSVFMEYRPAGILGLMFNVGYDGRGAKFDGVIAPCDCPATLKTNMSYLSVEPSLRFSMPSSRLYFFAGPRIGFNLQTEFKYTQQFQPDTEGELSAVKEHIISGQVGMGYEFPISSPANSTQVSLSPFISYHPYFGQDPRDIESLSISTVRTGIALKFGKLKKSPVTEPPVVVVPLREVNFTVNGPIAPPINHQISELLPLRNSVFFDEGSSAIPNRYIVLTKDEAGNFKEESLQLEQTGILTGRSARQLNVYHNILNILGDRMRTNPEARINLSGASAQGPQEGKVFAESVKQYIVSVFGIEGSRIKTEGRTKPLIPSEKPGATKELVLLHAGDRRVDITSTSPELLMEVGVGMMKPVQIIESQKDSLNTQVVLNVDGAKDLLKSWSVDITDENGTIQHCGPFTSDQESITVNSILGERSEGDYKIIMTGETKAGLPVNKQGSLHLVRQNEIIEKSFRYSILFDFDNSKTIASYEKFLIDVVSPLITDGSTVIIHGHTDVIGDEVYNHTLSHNRALETHKIIENALSNAGKKDVKFETSGFGEEVSHSPFDNTLPEERFYNRTVIIDIVPVK
ncbi:MAG: OmpA family protein [Daejeonella sp.]